MASNRSLWPALAALAASTWVAAVLSGCSPPKQGNVVVGASDGFVLIDTGSGGIDADGDAGAGDGAIVDAIGDGAIVDALVTPDAAVDGAATDTDSAGALDAASDTNDAVGDGANTDGTAADAAANPDASSDGGSGGPSVCDTFVCGQLTFSFTPPAGTTTVKLAGSMNAWKVDFAPELLDGDGDGTFELTTMLSPGTYQYKFVAGDKWSADPNNPFSVADGYGGQNSLLIVPSCAGPLTLLGHSTDENAGTFDATFDVDGGPLSLADVAVTVDWQAAPAGALTWKVPGTTLALALNGLAPGIHDVRVGCGPHALLLKVTIKAPSDWRDVVLYFAMTDRFVNGDASNDAPFANMPAQTNWQGGDFKGLQQKVNSGYFSDLGVGAIWISWPVAQPTTAEPGGRPDAVGCNLDAKKISYVQIAYSGYHGYWPVQPDVVEPRFGTLAELNALVTAAHSKGIRILLDFTANHVHTDSPWFKDHQDDGWFHLPAEVCGDIGWDVKPIECWFTNYLADFDHDGPARYALLDSAISWAKKTGVDGFRVDAVKHVEMGFVEDLRRRVQDELELTGFPFWLVGETFTGDAGAIAAFVSPTRLHGQFDFAGNYAILETFAKQWKGLDGLDASWRGSFAIYGPDALMSTFLGNHDIARFLSVAAGTLKCGIWDMVSDQAAGWKSPPTPEPSAEPYERLRLAFAWLYAVPGIPLVYHGDEFGMPGAGDPDNRRMMRFGSALTTNEAATLTYLQALGKARAAHPALRKGTWAPALWAEADFIAFARTLGEDRVVVVINRGAGDKTATLDVSGVGFADGTALVDAISGAGGVVVSGGVVSGGKLALTVPARTARYFVASK